ncbi:hypothetical protein Nepgr_002584 [Nepenthes gracilis]|uniref:Uncharacterized protein n=1 Tax=Nepenthes gracilis TaxID=150966 RepID=A0AAD3P836_NEPGR|nr:hypothetical protein Nepgr_002584 [Nepenthes gracilis]
MAGVGRVLDRAEIQTKNHIRPGGRVRYMMGLNPIIVLPDLIQDKRPGSGENIAELPKLGAIEDSPQYRGGVILSSPTTTREGTESAKGIGYNRDFRSKSREWTVAFDF